MYLVTFHHKSSDVGTRGGISCCNNQFYKNLLFSVRKNDLSISADTDRLTHV